MLRQFLLLVACSVIIILALPYAHIGLKWLVSSYDQIMGILSNVFATGKTASMIKQALTLLFIPIAISAVASGIYWSIKRSSFPYMFLVVWAIWLVLATVIVLQYKPGL